MATGLKGKVAVITGAASGIGLATANALMDAGATWSWSTGTRRR